jgi:hypothetical protein
MKKFGLILTFLAVGCGETPAQINITKMIGSEGGTVSGSDGTSLTVPMGALSTSANITISPITVTPPAGTVLVGPAYDFQPEGTQFAQSVTIALPFDSAKIPTGLTSADILIYTAPRGSTNYQMMFTAVDGNTVTTSTTHLSVYLPATPAAACTAACTGNTASSQTCSCNATCNGNTQMIGCSQGSGGGLFCYCELNHQTMSGPTVTSCDQIQQAFDTCFKG